jgi:hypothetical protein
MIHWPKFPHLYFKKPYCENLAPNFQTILSKKEQRISIRTAPSQSDGPQPICRQILSPWLGYSWLCHRVVDYITQSGTKNLASAVYLSSFPLPPHTVLGWQKELYKSFLDFVLWTENFITPICLFREYFWNKICNSKNENANLILIISFYIMTSSIFLEMKDLEGT